VQIRELRVPRATGSYADSLFVIGVADLLRRAGADRERQVIIRSEGGNYLVQLNPELDTDLLRGHSIEPGFKFLLLKGGDPRAEGADTFEYEAAKAIEARAKAATRLRTSKKAQQLAEEAGVADDLAVDPDLAGFKIYNSMRAGSDSYNQLHHSLRQMEKELGDIVAGRLESLYGTPGLAPPRAAAEAKLRLAASSLQFWNPIAGKGVSRPKPNGTKLDSLPDKFVDWFAEWMRFRAFDIAMLAFRTGDDFKIFVLDPADAPVSLIREVRSELAGERMWGGLKLDIIALLTLARALVSRSPAASNSSGTRRFSFARRAPNRIIRGFSTAFFKSLGAAPATMNISFLGLPGWFPVETREQASAWLDTLEEYRARLRVLNEDHSDHISVLLAFRDFLSSGRLAPALDFFGQYAALLTKQSERLIPFTERTLRRIIVSYDNEVPGLAEIVQDEGFQNVARAIRACTIEAQWQKGQIQRGQRSDPLRIEIRYGLAQDWRRSVDRRDEFVQKLADFVSSYNAEAARTFEKGDPPPWLISADDLSRVLALIERTDDQSPGLVGRLLIAFGYATAWRTRTPNEPDANAIHGTETVPA